MRLLLLLSFIAFNISTAMSQSRNAMVDISGISVYQDFEQRGYTTAGASTHIDEMRRDGISQIRVDDARREKLENIINRADKKRHYQTKLGTDLIFGETVFVGSNTSNKIVISGVGVVSKMFGRRKEERAFIIDLTRNTDYKITNQEDLTWLTDFREKMKITIASSK